MKLNFNKEVVGIVSAYGVGILVTLLLVNFGGLFNLNKKLPYLNSKASNIGVSDWKTKCASAPVFLPGCEENGLPTAVDGEIKGVLARSVVSENNSNRGAVNLVQNGSFENPVLAEQSTLFPGGAGSLFVWDIDWVNKSTATPMVEVVSGDLSGWSARDGKQFLSLDASGAGGLVKISQNIATEKTLYSLSFWFAGQPNTKADENLLKVYWNGELLQNLSQDGSQSKDTVWQKYTFTVTGAPSISQLQFVPGGRANGKGVLLDNVSVVKQ